MQFTNLDLVPAVVRDSVREYAERVVAYGAEHVLGLTIYGAAAGPAFDGSVHMVHSLLMLDSLGLEILRRLSGDGTHFGRRRITAPVVMTPEFLTASHDAFPLELIEIQQQRLVLLGEDYLAGVSFDAAHVRLQCERELKSLSIGMRQAVVVDGTKESSIHKAALPALFGLVRVLRGMLWLKERREAWPAAKILAEIETLAGRHLPGIRQAFDFPSSVSWLTFERLYTDVEVLGQLVDGW
jgi:hypothetical protein